MWKVTFTYRGYVAGIFYNYAATECEAIGCAELHCCARWDNARAEKV